MVMANIINLNIGGTHYSTSLSTLRSMKEGLLAAIFKDEKSVELPKDNDGRYFIDRDGALFRYILDYNRTKKLLLPDNFTERERLRQEAEYYRLPEMLKLINIKSGSSLPPTLSGGHNLLNTPLPASMSRSITNTELSDRTGSITIGYRGTFTFGRDGVVDVKFRKFNRILVCGKVTLCRAVFGETLNESRDPDRGDAERYSARFFLKHNFIEMAFDMLIEAGFTLRGSCGTGTNSIPTDALQAQSAAKHLNQQHYPEGEEGKWYHYNEFVWVKEDCSAIHS